MILAPIKSYIKRADNHFQLISVLTFITGLYNIIYKFEWAQSGIVASTNLWNPSWLLLGPLLYFSLRSISAPKARFKPKDLLHLVPFLILLFCYLLAMIQTNMNDPWKTSSFVYYQNSYFLIAFSLLPYSFYCLSRIYNSDQLIKSTEETLVVALSGIYILVAIVVVMIFTAWGIVNINMGVDYRYFSYALIFFACIAITWYWSLPAIKKLPLSHSEEAKIGAYRNSSLTSDMAARYKEDIVSHFKSTKAYLTPNLSLDHLSKELNIPKHYLSQLFNMHFEKNFHNFIAAYRIAHAIDLLNENHGKLKIESLAYACGFNSKTSFNRYFKEITGFAPSAYQLKLEDQTQE